MDGTLRCCRCQKVKAHTEFFKDVSKTTGYSPHCKECNKEAKKHYRDNRPKRLETRRQWKLRNLEKQQVTHQVVHAKSRSKKYGHEQHFTLSEWLVLCQRYGNKCLCCGATDKRLTVDHIVPLSKGGTNIIDNIQPLCKRCNEIKSNKSIDYRPNCTKERNS